VGVVEGVGRIAAEVDRIARGERGGGAVHIHLDRAGEHVYPLLPAVRGGFSLASRYQLQLHRLEQAQRRVRQRLQRGVAGGDGVTFLAARHIDGALFR
jgi:hypothetical protein